MKSVKQPRKLKKVFLFAKVFLRHQGGDIRSQKQDAMIKLVATTNPPNIRFTILILVFIGMVWV